MNLLYASARERRAANVWSETLTSGNVAAPVYVISPISYIISKLIYNKSILYAKINTDRTLSVFRDSIASFIRVFLN